MEHTQKETPNITHSTFTQKSKCGGWWESHHKLHLHQKPSGLKNNDNDVKLYLAKKRKKERKEKEKRRRERLKRKKKREKKEKIYRGRERSRLDPHGHHKNTNMLPDPTQFCYHAHTSKKGSPLLNLCLPPRSSHRCSILKTSIHICYR
jgi:hypothetical protein